MSFSGILLVVVCNYVVIANTCTSNKITMANFRKRDKNIIPHH